MNRLPKTTTKPVSTASAIDATSKLEEQIRRRAYELYEQRGREDGHEINDWLQAEAEARQMEEKGEAA